MASASVAHNSDVLAGHFGNDRASLKAFLDLQLEDLRLISDAALAQEVAEASLLDAASMSDAQLAQTLADAEELHWAQVRHDEAFAKEVAGVPDAEWEDTGDWLEKDFDASQAERPDVSVLGLKRGVCGICMETVDYLTIISGCSHAFCHNCLKQYIIMKVKEKTAPLKCCGLKCEAEIDSSLVLRIAGRQVADAHEKDLVEAAMRNKTFCPFPGCGAVYDLDESVSQVQCLECWKVFCGNCRVAWHDGLTCEQYKRLPDHLRAPEDVALLRIAQRQAWRPCPGCRNMLSKQDGDCNYLRCRCGTAFCFRCGNKYINDQPQANNVHGRAGCTCPLFDANEEEANNAGPGDDDLDRVIPPPPQIEEQPPQPGGLLKFGNAKMRWHQKVNLVDYKERVDAGQVACPAWLAARLERMECCYCARAFNTLRDLDTHLQNTRAHPVYACCGRIFLDFNGFSQHAEIHRRKK
eukprot:TRINITY_DN39714_c0_g1_i1.p1 TRINITY_DN39714_c0_g1~~TRINITY_DN39714_c0_g1_i1.p1  ORF type:complete len:466 (+),score=65.26 TRINITY_DN39714_c0_g1_i1:73-1470(+)